MKYRFQRKEKQNTGRSNPQSGSSGKRNYSWGITLLLVTIAGISFYYMLFKGANIRQGFRSITAIVMPILDGLILAFLMTPIVNWIEHYVLYPFYKKTGLDCKISLKKLFSITRMISIVLTLIIVGAVVYEFFALIIPQIINSIQSIIMQIPIYADQITDWAEKLLADNPDAEKMALNLFEKYYAELEKWLNSKVLPQMNMILKTVSLSMLSLLKATWNMIIGLIISIYIMASKEVFAGQCKKIIYAVFETRTANTIIHDCRFTYKTFNGFISGKILDSVIIGILCFIAINFMGMPYPVLISVIIGVTNIIPFFGPYFGAVPSALLILMINPMQCLYFVIFILVLQQFDGNVLGPKILGDSTGLSGFWVIFSITLFGGLFGVLGMIVGVPVFAVIYAGARTTVNRMLKRRKLPIETEKYCNVGEIKNKEFITSRPRRKGDKKIKNSFILNDYSVPEEEEQKNGRNEL